MGQDIVAGGKNKNHNDDSRALITTMQSVSKFHQASTHSTLDLLDQRRVAHARHTAVRANVGGHPLQRHHCHGTGVLGNFGLLCVDNVYEKATLTSSR